MFGNYIGTYCSDRSEQNVTGNSVQSRGYRLRQHYLPWTIITSDRLCIAGGFRFASILRSPFFSCSCHYARAICLPQTNGPLSRKFLRSGTVPEIGHRNRARTPARTYIVHNIATHIVSVIS